MATYPTLSGGLPSGNFGYGELVNLDQQLGLSAGNQATFNGPDGLVYQIVDRGGDTFGLQQTGQTVAGNNALNLAQQLQQMQIQANQPAIQTLQTQYNPATGSGALVDRYNSLLSSINQQGSVAVNQATLGAAQALGQRGILPSSALYQQQVGSAILPATTAYAGLTAQTGLGEQQDLGNIAAQIASLQTGNVQGAITGATNLQNLSQQAELLPSEIALQQGQAAAAQAQAKYIPTGYGGNIFNTAAGSFSNPLLQFLMG